MTEPHSETHYSFDCAGQPLAARLVLITGITRSGTTLLGNLVGSLKDTEYDFEPWIFHCVPMMAASGQIQRQAAVEIFRGYFNETLTSFLHGRGVNFRPTDDTRIWNRIPLDEVFSRWYQLKDRWDVKRYAQDHQSIFSFKVTNFGPFFNLLWNAFPQLKIIHILRHPLHVALSIQKKGWFNLDRLQQLEGLPIKKVARNKDGNFFIPWWVEEEEVESFLKMSDFARALYCWRVIMERTEEQKKRLNLSEVRHQDRYYEVRYEDLLKDPKSFIEGTAKFMGTNLTGQTQTLLQTVRSERLKEVADFPLDEISEEEKRRVAKLLEAIPYELPQFA